MNESTIDVQTAFQGFFKFEKYRERLSRMAVEGRTSLVLNFEDLMAEDVELARNLLKNPDEYLQHANRAAYAQLQMEDPEYAERIKECGVNVRVTGLPEATPLRSLGSEHVGKLVMVEGIVVRATSIRPMVVQAAFKCKRCDEIDYVDQTGTFLTAPPRCRNPSCDGRTFDFIQEKSTFVDSQELRVQERPEDLPPGQLPRSLSLKLVGKDLVNVARPGDHVSIVGIVRATAPSLPRAGRLRAFTLHLDVNFIDVLRKEPEAISISPEEEQEILKIARNPDVHRIIVKSIAPSIYGYDHLKEAIMYLLFGGVPKTLPDISIRGELNALLVGDPGTGKCVIGDTLVVLADGTITEIEKIVNSALDSDATRIEDGYYKKINHIVTSLGLDGRLGEEVCSAVWKRSSPQYLYEVLTGTGKRILVTPTHPFFTIKDGMIVPIEAQRLRVGDYIATPRRLRVNGRPQALSALIDRGATNAHHIPIPLRTSPELCRIIGYLLGDGYCREGETTYQVVLTNSDAALKEDFATCFEDVFGIRPYAPPSHVGKEVQVTSVEVGRFLKSLAPSLFMGSERKEIPEVLTRCSDEEITHLLRAYFDCDATISQRNRSIELTSASGKLVRQVQLLLLRFGIISHIGRKVVEGKTYHRLGIYSENLEKYARSIGFLHPKKRERLEKQLLSRKAFNPNVDVIPNVHNVIRRLRSTLRLYQKECGVPRTSLEHYESGAKRPPPTSLRRIAEAFNKRLIDIPKIKESVNDWRSLRAARLALKIPQDELASMMGVSQTLISQYEHGKLRSTRLQETKKALENICKHMLNEETISQVRRLKMLAASDIFWDRVVDVRKVGSVEEWVYDLQVDETHNFIAEGIVVHNSQLLQYVARIAPRGLYTSGRGTSIAREEPIIIKEKGVIKIVSIGELVDRYYGEDEFDFFVPVNNLECLSYNGETGRLEWSPISYVYRHKYRGRMIKIHLQTGRNITVTDDHSIFVFEDGEIKTKKASKIGENDYVVIPSRMPANGDSITEIVSHSGRTIKVDEGLMRLLGYYIAEGYLHFGKKPGKQSYRVHFELNSKETHIIRDIIEITKELFGVLPTVRRRRNSNGVVVSINNKEAFLLLRDVIKVSSGAKRKRVPEIVFNVPPSLQMEFLKAYVNGDRGIAASEGLISDILYLLLQCKGIAGKFIVKKKSNSFIKGRRVIGGPHFRLKSPSVHNLKSDVRALYPPLRHSLYYIEKLYRSPKSGHGFIISGYERLTPCVFQKLMRGKRAKRFERLQLLSQAGWSSAIKLSHSFGVTRRAVRAFLKRCAADGLIEVNYNNGHLYVRLTQTGANVLDAMKRLMRVMDGDVQFARVRKVELMEPSYEYVYDISVEGRENFVAGVGGILCHNTAAGLCVGPDAFVMTEMGALKIEELVDEQLRGGESSLGQYVKCAIDPKPCLLAAPSEGMDSAEWHKAVQFYRLRADRVIRISAILGRSITVTPETPILCLEKGERIIWKKAADVKVGDHLAVLRQLCEPKGWKGRTLLSYLCGDYYLEMHEGIIEKILVHLKRRYGTLKEASKALNVPEGRLYYDWKVGRSRPSLDDMRRIYNALGWSEEQLARDVAFIRYKSFRAAERVRIPLYPTLKFMELLGDMYSNGAFIRDERKKNSITIGYYKGDERYLLRFCERIRKLFGINVSVKKDPRENRYVARFNNAVVAELLRSFGVPEGDKHSRLRIPERICNMPNRLLARFIRQLATNDGGVISGKCVTFSTASSYLANQLCLLLQRFGILCALRERAREAISYRGKTISGGKMYELNIYDKRSLETFSKEIGLDDSVKRKKLMHLIRTKKGSHSNFKQRGGLVFLKVRSVREEPASYVYDLTVNDSHAFIANGFVVHNTAAVIRDKTGGMSLEAGALVLADKGVAAIDELDKMRPEDRVAMHQAMEQHTISIAKGGIVATLNARTAILAAANPALGRYDPYRTVADNIALPITILSRFDLIFVMRDVPEKEMDSKMCDHILSLHQRGSISAEPLIPPDLLRKYISYARTINPVLTDEAVWRLREFYLAMRSASEAEGSPIAITARQLEALVRLAEARARAALRKEVLAEDAEAAIAIMRRSLEEVGIDVSTRMIDIDAIMTGKPKSLRDKLQVALGVVIELEKEVGMAEREAVLKRLEQYGIKGVEADRLIERLVQDGVVYSPREGFLKKT